MSRRETFAAEDLARHGFLGGRLQVSQPRNGYRSGVDAVYLAAAAPAEKGESVLDLGAGAGVASLCLGSRVPGLMQHGLEVQEPYADLALSNSAATGLPLTVHHGDVEDMPLGLRAISFDGVIANPPYYRSDAIPVDEGAPKDTAHREQVPLAVWVDAALRRAKPGGWIVFIQKADRLAELLVALADRAGNIHVKPLAGRVGRPASRIVLRARKGARGPLVLCAPLIEHDGAAHTSDCDDFSAEASAILRDGQAMVM